MEAVTTNNPQPTPVNALHLALVAIVVTACTVCLVSYAAWSRLRTPAAAASAFVAEPSSANDSANRNEIALPPLRK